MKFNAKLGGTTTKAISKAGVKPFPIPTIVIGADVSHASPGSMAPSVAAMTMSQDKYAIRYAGATAVNGKNLGHLEALTNANALI